MCATAAAGAAQDMPMLIAALGPVLGGLLTSIDWRLVFLINVPLAIVTIMLTLSATPALRREAGEQARIDYAGTVVFGQVIVALVFGLSPGQSDGWGALDVVLSLAGAVLLLAVFVLVGALACLVLVRRESRLYIGPVFGRRSRWTYANVGATPGISRHPPEDANGSAESGPPGDRSG